jgi:glycosyltransferase involved in cell wall biosynthesis
MFFLSVVVPTYARGPQLTECLRALANLDYPRHRFEVIVVDDGSPENLEDVVAPWRQVLDLTLIRQEHAGPAAARNRGAQRARGTHLAFTDDDCVPARGWLTAIAKSFEAAPDHLIGGRTINALPKNRFSSASQVLISYLCGYFDGQGGRPRLFTSNNLAVPAAAFRAMGAFDTGFPRAAGEDREFCDRWVHYGLPSSYSPDAVVRHAHPMTFRLFCRQHFEYGRAAVSFRRQRALRLAAPVRIEPPSFYVNLLRFPFSAAETDHAWTCAALIALSQVANASGFLWSNISTRRLRQNSRVIDRPARDPTRSPEKA